MARSSLEVASLLYLALPWFIFAVGWLHRPWAACMVGALLVVAVNETRQLERLREPAANRWGRLAALIAVAAAWTGLSGAGGFGLQNIDWEKHNLLLDSLIDQRWPVDYVVLQQEGSRALPLVYYVAYYLPAAVVGKAAGWTAANVAFFLYTSIGTVLALGWFAMRSRCRPVPSSLLFVACSGLDVVGWLLFSRPYNPTVHLEWWAGSGLYQYSSNTSLLFWVPQHTLAGWVATGLVLCGERGEPSPGRAFLVLALLLLWSPFAALGLLPFALAAITTRPWSALTVANFVTAPVLGIVALLLLVSRADPLAHGWLFSGQHGPYEVGKLTAFYVLEVGGFALLAWPGRDERRVEWRIALALLLVLPLYRVGLFNDFTMRASIPALFVLWSYVAAALIGRSSARRSPRWIALAALVCIGAVTPANEIARSLAAYPWSPATIRPASLMVTNPFFRLYLGDDRSWFFRHVARPLRQVVTIEAEHPRTLARGARAQGDGAASNGQFLMVAADGETALPYGFDLAHPIHETTLVVRYRAARTAPLAVAIDGSPRAELSLPADPGRWRFADTSIGTLAAGDSHELMVRTRAPGTEIDAFVLIEGGR